MFKKSALLIGFVLASSQFAGGLKALDQGFENLNNAINKTQSITNSPSKATLDEETFCKGLSKRLNSAEAIIEYDTKCQKKY